MGRNYYEAKNQWRNMAENDKVAAHKAYNQGIFCFKNLNVSLKDKSEL